MVGETVPTRAARAGGPVGNLLCCLLMCGWVTSFGPNPTALGTVPGVVGALLLAERCRSWFQFVAWISVFGALAIGYGYRWLAETVQRFGGLSESASWLVTAAYGVMSTAHAWVAGLGYRLLLVRGRRPHPITTAVLIVACECLPIRLFGWMSGHGAVDVAPLLQAAEWGGVPAVSFALLCLVVPVHEFLRAALGLAGPPPRLRAAAVTFGVGALLFGVGWIRVASVASEEESAERRWKVAIVQANIGSLEKRSAERGADGPARRTAAAYERGSRRAVEAGAELIVWPETAVTHRVPTGDPQLMNYNLRREGYGFLMELGRGRSFLLGLYEGARDASDPRTGASRDRRYNSAALRHPGAEDATWSIYRKVHLIPFGEFVPIALLEGVVRLPQSFEMLRGGADQPPLEDAGRRIVPFLCYEGILPDHVRDLAGDDRPDLLASLANDSWFGDTWEPHQHLNFTRIRAVEHRTPMVRATNTGISAFVSATGAVTARLGVGAEGILVADLPLVERGTTLFVRFGHLLPWVAWLWSLAAVVLALARSERLVE